MNRTDLIYAISQKTGLTKAQSTAALRAFTDTVIKALEQGDKVQVTGFGVFDTTLYTERTARDLNTGKQTVIPAKRVVAFHAGAGLKKKLNSKG